MLIDFWPSGGAWDSDVMRQSVLERFVSISLADAVDLVRSGVAKENLNLSLGAP